MSNFYWWDRLLIYLIKGIGLPDHVAIIMDGNRRFARKQKNSMPLKQGHEHGFKKLIYISEVCRHLGIKYLTVYAFSLANFNRTSDEIEDLFNLAETKFKDQHWLKNILLKNDIQLRFSGDYNFINENLRDAIKENIEMTRNCKGIILTLCIAYGGRHEIAQSMEMAKHDYINYHENSSSISISDSEFDWSTITYPSKYSNNSMDQTTFPFEKFLYNPDIPYPDLLIRTSGETRLSDFLIYQCSEKTSFRFIHKLWPEFSIIDFLLCLFHFRVFG